MVYDAWFIIPNEEQGALYAFHFVKCAVLKIRDRSVLVWPFIILR